MLFNSFNFLIFFPVVTGVYFMLPYRWRWLWLLLASCFFYMFFIPAYILILAITILIDYFAGIYIAKSAGKKRKLYLIISIISTCLVLFVFKYFNFFIGNINTIAGLLHWNYSLSLLNIILPIGLSFHTFQSLSYVIEVYRGRQTAEKHFGIYALYVMFYPQLVAGPIERPQNMLPQFHAEKKFDYNLVVSGLGQMLLGLFKKIFLADRLAILVNSVYNNPTDFHGLTLITATVLFAFQIYFDFSGYSDIALGAARVMGFKLMDNFNRPYFSSSVGEFWRRWHISLSTWFRDYVYIPLGGSRVSKWRWVLNIMITFIISGFWHGAAWTFVIWGALHGMFLVVETGLFFLAGKITKVSRKFLGICSRLLATILTFTAVCFAWIFFRAQSLSDASYIIKNLFNGLGQQLVYLVALFRGQSGLSETLDRLWPGVAQIDLLIAIVSIFAFLLFEGNLEFWHKRFVHSRVFRWAIYISVIMLILYFGVFDNSQFIYFQF
jgi:alginate O-acetyltransferase complex protein AlgI